MAWEDKFKLEVLVISFSFEAEFHFVAPGLGIEVANAEEGEAFQTFLERIVIGADEAMEKNMLPLFADHAPEKGDYVVPAGAEELSERTITLEIECERDEREED